MLVLLAAASFRLEQCRPVCPQSLSADELEELKNEVVSEVVDKIAGEVRFCACGLAGVSVQIIAAGTAGCAQDGTKLADFLEPEVCKWTACTSWTPLQASLGGLLTPPPPFLPCAAYHRALRPALPEPQPGAPLLCAIQRVLQVSSLGCCNVAQACSTGEWIWARGYRGTEEVRPGRTCYRGHERPQRLQERRKAYCSALN